MKLPFMLLGRLLDQKVVWIAEFKSFTAILSTNNYVLKETDPENEGNWSNMFLRLYSYNGFLVQE